MNTSPRVTIMIPTYNQAAVLPKAIGSALGQDYDNLEVVVADDCSTDATETAMRPFLRDPRVRYVRNPANLGRVRNYKQTLEKYASGRWVANLDADDFYTDPAFISTAIRLILAAEMQENDGTVVFLQAGHTVRDGNGAAIRTDLPDIGGAWEIIPGTRYFLDLHHFSHLATLYDREMAIGLDFYRYDILSADMESLLRLALHGRVILLKASVGDWIQHDANESRRLDIPTVDKNMLRIEGPFAYARSLGILPEDQLLRWRHRLIRTYIRSYLILSLRHEEGLNGYLRHVLATYPRVVTWTIIPAAVFHAQVSKFRRFFAAVSGNYAVRLWKGGLQKIYGFDKWHVVSLRQRKYARDIIEWCNRRPVRNAFLEIGCGLGDVVRHVTYRKRVGCDSDPKVLKAAAFLTGSNRKYETTFCLCRFPDAPPAGRYDVILLVNWIHHIPPEVLQPELQRYFDTLLAVNGAIIVDTVHHPEYQFNHEITQLAMGMATAVVERLGGYERGREVWAMIRR